MYEVFHNNISASKININSHEQSFMDDPRSTLLSLQLLIAIEIANCILLLHLFLPKIKFFQRLVNKFLKLALNIVFELCHFLLSRARQSTPRVSSTPLWRIMSSNAFANFLVLDPRRY